MRSKALALPASSLHQSPLSEQYLAFSPRFCALLTIERKGLLLPLTKVILDVHVDDLSISLLRGIVQAKLLLH